MISLIDADSQDYSIVVSEINTGVKKDLEATSVTITVPPVQYTETTPVDFLVANNGTKDFSNAKLKIKLINKDDDRVEYENLVDIHPYNISGKLPNYKP
ncbi:hypothetical protein [Riemerella columbipharyngis]|uniref:Uncharacterized protein n=1 Tax=Riemerella columbipharyngis TaxID=1071918 RepID=A0A1G7AQF6_9FLAO|nr:hypothetical protein [Riemerella columbipharyngis]SDE16930.1 hypothetical protein SAMN05421544_10454 [Riemerella columbipharyngis]